MSPAASSSPIPGIVGSARLPGAARLPGPRDHQFRLCVVTGTKPTIMFRWTRRWHTSADRRGRAVPVNADFEGGFAVEPDQVAANVAAATRTGIAGLSIEDSTGNARTPLFDSRPCARADPGGTARDRRERHRHPAHRPVRGLHRRPARSRRDHPPAHRLRRGRRGLPLCPGHPQRRGHRGRRERGGTEAGQRAGRQRLHHGAELAEAGVRRISVGGALARAAWTGFLEAAREIAEHGTFTRLAGAVPFAELEGSFAAK